MAAPHRSALVAFSLVASVSLSQAVPADEPARGSLHVHPANPRYFADGSGKAVYLAGSHTWSNLQDQGPKDRPKAFDYDGYLAFLKERNHNVIRLWAWEQARWAPWSDGKEPNPDDWFVEPNPYTRTGPGAALDGKPKFDLDRFDDAYFQRLRERVEKARQKGIYVSVMLFQVWSSAKSWLGGTPWRGHPYHPDNNVQGFNGNTHGDDGPDINDPRVRARQAAYICKVVDTLSDLDNVLYEVTNEGGNKDWDWFVVNTVHADEKTKPEQHPVGLTGHGSESNDEMVASPADWFSPGSNDWPDLKTDPRPVDGKKVSLLDTDHVFDVGGDQKRVWKGFLRGHNVLFMDPYDDPAWAPILAGQGVGVRDAEASRRAMGLARSYSVRMDLAASRPAGELVSTGYCLAVPGSEYLTYLPDGGDVTIDLSGAAGLLSVEWAHPITGRFLRRVCAAVVEASPEKPASAVPVGTVTGTVLGVRDTSFTLNGEPTFLLGMSYYGALGAPEEFVRRDLDDLTRHGFNWVRVWSTWRAFDRDVSAVDVEGQPREPFLGRLRWLVAECDRRGLVVDVTLTRGDGTNGGAIPNLQAHRWAVETLVGALKVHRNWYLDLANERDIRDARHVPAEELQALRDQVRALDPSRLVTASFGGHDLDEADLREALMTIGLDFVAPPSAAGGRIARPDRGPDTRVSRNDARDRPAGTGALPGAVPPGLRPLAADGG